MDSHSPRPRALTQALLARWPLPATAANADKESRGHVLVVGGCSEMPGAVLLAATAALRAGAGKLTMASPRSVAQGLALAMPEARVIGLDETRSGTMAARGAARLAHLGDKVGAVVVGPGMVDEARSTAFVQALLPHFRDSVVVLDAYAMSAVGRKAFDQPIVITPHCGEIAHLMGGSKEDVLSAPLRYARSAAARWGACVALKGADTYIVQADGAALHFKGGTPGLGVSGSGDTLAGIIAGIAARGTSGLQACAWGVVLHALAGRALSRGHGPLGLLARELPGQVPRLMHALAGRVQSDGRGISSKRDAPQARKALQQPHRR